MDISCTAVSLYYNDIMYTCSCMVQL